MSGVYVDTCGKNRLEIISLICDYIDDTFNDMKFMEDFDEEEIRLWAIEHDDDFNDCYPNVISVHY